MGFPLVDQPMVYFIGNDRGGETCYLVHSLAGEYISRRVGGGIDKDAFRPRTNLGGDHFGNVLKAFLFQHIHENGHPTDVLDDVGITGVIGIGQYELVSFFQQRGEKQEHCRGGSRCDENLVWCNWHTVRFLVIRGNGLPQLE